MFDKPKEHDMPQNCLICPHDKLKQSSLQYVQPGPLKAANLRSARRMFRRLSLFTLLVVSLGVHRNAESQTNKDLGQGAPLNFIPMNQYETNLSKQTLTFLRLPGISPDYRLGAGDVIKIDVLDSKFFSQTYKISNSGKINFPLLGTIQAEGLTAEELESGLGRQLIGRRLLKSPEVLVYIESYEAKPISVIGEVDYPGEYRMSQQLTLMDAIFLAGGLDFTASRYGYLHRKISSGQGSRLPVAENAMREKQASNIRSNKPILLNPEIALPGTEVIKVDLQPMKEGGVLAQNILMRAGDVFVVPKRKVEAFYVVGEVVYAGAFEIPQGASLKASQALSWAGGTTKTAQMGKGILVRYDENGNRQEMKIDYAAILEGRQPDFSVHPNDILFVPGSRIKTLGYGLLGVIPSTVQGTVTNRSANH